MSNLADLVEAFKREVAVPGAFADAFPSTSDDDLEEALKDAFSQARLDGFFATMDLNVDTGEVTPDLSLAGGALVVIYAGMRMVRNQLRAANTVSRYKAGPVEYETQVSAQALTEELKQLERRRNELIQNAQRAGRGAGTTFMLDAYLVRAGSWTFYGGFFPYEMYGGFYPSDYRTG